MPKTDRGPFGPAFERRLQRELDRVQPRFSPPRYRAATGRPIAGRLAPVALAISLVGILGLSAYAATGSPNPVVWTQHVVTVIRPNPATAPPITSPDRQHGGPAATPSQHSLNEPSAEPSEPPEPTDKPEPKESPEPSGDNSDGGSTDHSGSGTSSGGDPTDSHREPD